MRTQMRVCRLSNWHQSVLRCSAELGRTCSHILHDADSEVLVHHGVQAAHSLPQQQFHLHRTTTGGSSRDAQDISPETSRHVTVPSRQHRRGPVMVQGSTHPCTMTV